MINKFKSIDKKIWHCFFVAALLLGFLATRLWRVTTIPQGLHVDEAAIAYDAWSLANYGVDRHLKSWPVYLINFGGGQNVLYCYLCAGLFKLFGFSVLLLRLPAIFFSFLTLIFGMMLVKKVLSNNFALVLITGGLLVICPYFIMAGRFGLESNLMLGASTVFLYCFICAMESGKYSWYILAGITGGVTLYTYAISYLVLPVFLLSALIYSICVRRFSFIKWVGMGIPMFFLAFPLLLEQYINAFDQNEIRLGIFTVTRLSTYRSSEIGYFQWQNFCKVLYKVFVGDWEWMFYNSIPGFPNLYYVTIPLVMAGAVNVLFNFWKTLRKREFSVASFVLIWFFAILLVGSSIWEPNVNKLNGIFFSVIFLTVEGIDLLLKAKRYWGQIAVGICGVLYFAGFIRFSTYYYLGGYSTEYRPLPLFAFKMSEAISFLEEHPQFWHNGTYLSENAVFLAVSSLMSPYDLAIDESAVDICDYYHCGLPEVIEDGYNYIVQDYHAEYAQQLRDCGYTEIRYAGYSLFYQEEWVTQDMEVVD